MLRRWAAVRQAGIGQTQVNPGATEPALPADGRLRLLSFNIQVGISTQRYHHYLTRSWQHLLPHRERADNLRRIGHLLRDYDLVALQEVDGGSLRSGFINQVEQLALLGGFPYWYQQLNRNLGRLGQHSNGMLSRWRPDLLEDHPLPGPRGRGAIFARFGQGQASLMVVIMHLALGAPTRARQLAYIRERVQGCRHLILMGDMNTHASDLLQYSALRDLQLAAPSRRATFPSWQPQHCLDHILLSPELILERAWVMEPGSSDHLPVAVDIRLPAGLLGSDRTML